MKKGLERLLATLLIVALVIGVFPSGMQVKAATTFSSIGLISGTGIGRLRN